MAGKIDLSRLREQTMGSGNEEEAVTVNTRALIDKVLARYSGDWTTLRELIQNAADAQATRVSIKFETLPSRDVPVPSSSDDAMRLKHVLMNHTLLRLTVSNNGQPFGKADWSRLKRIAEGNPDETKIGAFGVGFYSVFADCETPFVISGNESMAFYWKGNSLFTRTGTVDSGTSDTSFLLDYRNTTSPIPDLNSICQFLSTSLTFVGLQEIDLWVDDWEILSLSKKSAPSADVSLPRNIKTRTREQLMKVVGVVHQSTQIDAKWMNVIAWDPKKKVASSFAEDSAPAVPSLRSLFTKFSGMGSSSNKEATRKAAREAEAAQQAITEDIAGFSQATVFLRISTVNIQTYVSSSFAKEIERATKKPPPKHTRIAILTSSYDDISASSGTGLGLTANKSADIFSSVLPTRNGRIFIGFPTAQTTGMLCHISAPSIIPTVERESIDLNARWVRTWNVEMLRVAGIACRIAYAGELAEMKHKLDQRLASGGARKLSPEDIAAVVPLATHIFKQYTYQESTPSAQVGNIIGEAFWDCAENASIDVLSTKGVLPSHLVRVVTQPLSFLEDTPVIPQDLANGAEEFVRALYQRGLIGDMTVPDIKKELEARSLDERQLVEFLKWAGEQVSSNSLDKASVRNLLNAAVATITDDKEIVTTKDPASTGHGRILALSTVTTFLNEKKIPPDMIVPPTSIPYKFTKDLSRAQLEVFWEELQIVPWVRYLIEIAETAGHSQETNITRSPAFARRALLVISKQWESLSQSSRNTLTEVLTSRSVIPTKIGMRKPPDSYFASVKLFDDLPTVDGLIGVKEKFLVALGVRKTIALNVVFDRLMAINKTQGSENKWSFNDLVHYLASVREDIPAKDIDRLRTTAICPIEPRQGDVTGATRLHKITDVFEPTNDMRSLGLPVLQWSGPWRTGSLEVRFMNFLGLRAHPTIEEIITIMQNAAKKQDAALYSFAMNFWVTKHPANGYGKFDVTKIGGRAFLPILGQPFPHLVAPATCFTNERAAIFGYNILDPTFRPHALKFGVAPDPPITDVVNRLIASPPKSQGEAMHMFGYMAGRIPDITSTRLVDTLGKAEIVPIIKKNDPGRMRRGAPQLCFIGDKHDYDEFLDFVDFGQEANTFLISVGSKNEPTSVELAKVVVQNPARILGTLQQEKYLDLLRRLADAYQRLKTDKALWRELKEARWLLSYRDMPRDSKKKSNEPSQPEADDFLDEEPVTRTYALSKPSEIVIQDNYKFYQIFRDYLNIAPQEDVLESFYVALGVPTLESLVDVNERMGMPLRDQTEAQRLLKLIVQRSRVFLHEYNKEKCSHDTKWLEKHLSCQMIQSISTHLSLRTHNATYAYKRTALLSRDRPNTLCITTGYDLYEVSTAVVRLLLKRPKRNDAMAMETILTSRLGQLRDRGYNVERILQQEAYLSRIAEDERKKQQAEEQRRAKEVRDAKPVPPPNYEPTANNEKQIVRKPGKGEEAPPDYTSEVESQRSPDRPMPGAWDSPEQATKHKLPKFFSNITKQLEGFRGGANGSGGSASPTNSHVTAGPQPVTPQNNIHRNLVSAVQACRSHNSDTVFSEPHTTTVEEQRTGSYCDPTPGQDIKLFGDSASGIKIYVAKTLSSDPKEYISQHMAAINTFGYILLDIGSIFDIPPHCLHIFIDERGQTIAFNQSGALFCNFHFFSQLHEKGFNASREGRIDALSYWFVVLSHELAHNVVKEHGAQHSFYAESFCQQYFSQLMTKALQY